MALMQIGWLIYDFNSVIVTTQSNMRLPSSFSTNYLNDSNSMEQQKFSLLIQFQSKHSKFLPVNLNLPKAALLRE
jgi:hypothetical protein